VCECELQETPLGFETRRIRYMALGCSGEVWIHFALLLRFIKSPKEKNSIIPWIRVAKTIDSTIDIIDDFTIRKHRWYIDKIIIHIYNIERYVLIFKGIPL